MYQSVYGSANFCISEYTQIISDVETFVLEVSKFNHEKLFAEFQKTFIAKNKPDVLVKKTFDIAKLGGYSFKCNYSVFV